MKRTGRFECLTLLVLCMVSMACSNQSKSVDESQEGLLLSLVDEVVFQNLLTPGGMDIDSAGRIYVADRKQKHVKVFSPSGDLLHTIGRGGQGPGEFVSPASVSIHGQRIGVGDVSGRVTIFDLQGSYITSFVVPQIRHINSDIRIVNDSLILVGGYVLGEELLDGTLLHLYGIDGIQRHSFGPLSKTAQRMESVALSGAKFDFDDTSTFWSIQPTEYTISKYDLSGELVTNIEVKPSYFRPLNQKEPEWGGQTAYMDWMAHWDRPGRVFSLNDSVLVVSVQIGQPPTYKGRMASRTDFIRKRDGYVYQSVSGLEKLVFVDDKEQLYFEVPTTEEPVTRFRIYQMRGTEQMASRREITNLY